MGFFREVETYIDPWPPVFVLREVEASIAHRRRSSLWGVEAIIARVVGFRVCFSFFNKLRCVKGDGLVGREGRSRLKPKIYGDGDEAQEEIAVEKMFRGRHLISCGETPRDGGVCGGCSGVENSGVVRRSARSFADGGEKRR
ncbi:Uncharacterized protein Rs2_04767 [Raphanus sativus]|nr:Uncharacterized protein Rs2_04767 [Raphanus sativus]